MIVGVLKLRGCGCTTRSSLWRRAEDDPPVFWSGQSTFSLRIFINQPELYSVGTQSHTQVWDLALVVFRSCVSQFLFVPYLVK